MNKNTKHRKALAHKAMLQNQATFNYDGKTYKAASRPNQDSVVSQNLGRNSQMKIYRNFGQYKYQNTSLTAHEPISKEGGFKTKDKLKAYEKYSKSAKTAPKVDMA